MQEAGLMLEFVSRVRHDQVHIVESMQVPTENAQSFSFEINGF